MRTGRYSSRAGIALALALALGAGLGLAAMPRLFAAVPHDLRRTRVALRALAEAPPRLAVFGNSVAMCGIDAGALAGADGAPAYNLSSTGQTLAEGFLYYQELREPTHTLVYSLSSFALESPVAFNAHVVNAFVLYGYRPQLATQRALEGAFPAAALRELGEPPLTQRFEARWVVRELIDSGLRQLVRRDLDLERAFTDLEFPAPYTKKLPPEQLEAELRKSLGARPPGPFRAAPEQLALLAQVLEQASADGRRVLLALAPIHPRLREGYGPEFRAPLVALAERWRAEGALVLDSTELLEADAFIDPVHPTGEGAARWTAAIAAALGGAR